MEIKAAQVKELRDMTGAGMMDAKKALVDANGDMDKAIDILREKGEAKSVKKGNRIAAEGLIGSYVHGGRIGSMVEVNSETDFVAKNSEFQEFVKHVCMQVASMNPKYVSREDVPADVVEHEKEVLIQQAMNESENLPEDKRRFVAEKKVEGRLNKFFEEICLLDQAYILDPGKTVDQVRKDLIAKIGENIVIRRFTRFEVGEGIEKKQENFAEEVAKQMGL
ncbi:MAG: translation elongation factor Ts [Peptoniphilaceae bacterium]|nr:translation elongation factor Ts [Peptoniphilaceae bacterium]MCI6659632.1 translation elongation factor Ts [Peptoniphilaceae bacterium]MDD7433567.1 translation elongation factor Ts [Peptoniphilaceae bacterium]MDY3076032.1 translation elongation factor Ts [Peptoniphilaceae bacterium]MDY3986606.1 translation elongation factor Ts [Peptoniphilaceae bacterium]